MVLRVQNKTRNIIKTMKQNKISITRTNEMKTDKFIYNKQKKKRTLFLELLYKTDSFFFIFQSFFLWNDKLSEIAIVAMYFVVPLHV